MTDIALRLQKLTGKILNDCAIKNEPGSGSYIFPFNLRVLYISETLCRFGSVNTRAS